jgi:hypothetical protein
MKTVHYSPKFFLKKILILVFLSLFAIPSAKAETRVVKVGVYENAPKVFTLESGEPAGIFIDIIEHIAEREGWRLRYVPGTWAEGLDRLAEGKIDLMPDVANTAARAKIYDFHQVPVLSSWFQVYAGKSAGIRSILDLAGRKIAVLERSVQQEAFTQLVDGFELEATIIPVPDYRTIFAIVAGGEADAAITNRFYGVMHAKNFGLEDTKVVFHPTLLFFAAPKNAPKALLDTLDTHLSALKNDTESAYYQSLKRWISEEVPVKFPAWARIVAWIAGGVLLISLVGSAFLKRQVDIRTRQLRQINQEMETRIIQRTAELAEATEKAREADRIKSAFLATMSHELRTPLNSIIGFTGIMLQGLAGPLNPEQQKQMGMVQRSARHLLALINDVLDISKIEAGQMKLSVATFDVKASLEKTINAVLPLAQKKGLDIQSSLDGGHVDVTTDQVRFEQVVLNLLNNAVKFTEKGHIRVSCRVENNHCSLSVSDTGIGIKEDDLEEIFLPFHQIDTGTTRKHEGTGLGLSICKKIMDMMGGTIKAESRLGTGSTFTIRFPVHPEA